MYMFFMGGLMLFAMSMFLPPEIPVMGKYMLYIMGTIIAFIGLFILQTRAMKTGANHLLEFGRPNNIIWFI